MKLNIAFFSDLHLEHWRTVGDKELTEFAKKCEPADVVINGGDTGTANYPYLLDKFFPDQDYFGVTGNHDYYGGHFSNMFYAREIEGVKFFISTLWTNFRNNDLSRIVAQRSITDFRLIQGCTPEGMVRFYDDTVEALEAYKPHVVVTHFAPFRQCHDPKHGETPVNHYFVNDMEHILRKQPQIRLWCYGHTHSNIDFELDGRQVITQQLGYPGENIGSIQEFAKFSPKFITVNV